MLQGAEELSALTGWANNLRVDEAELYRHDDRAHASMNAQFSKYVRPMVSDRTRRDSENPAYFRISLAF